MGKKRSEESKEDRRKIELSDRDIDQMVKKELFGKSRKKASLIKKESFEELGEFDFSCNEEEDEY